jgi:hypothetical protein
MPALLTRATRSFGDALLEYAPVFVVPHDEGAGPLREFALSTTLAITGSPVLRAAGPFEGASAVTWSGSGQYATAAAAPTDPPAAVTAICWFRTSNATAASRFIFCRYQNSANLASWGLYLTSAHKARFEVYQSTAAAHATCTSSASFNDGKWHLAVGVFDGTTISLYIDGVLVASSTSLTNSWKRTTTTTPTIAALTTGTLPYPGDTSWAAIVNRGLAANDAAFLNAIGRGG